MGERKKTSWWNDYLGKTKRASADILSAGRQTYRNVFSQPTRNVLNKTVLQGPYTLYKGLQKLGVGTALAASPPTSTLTGGGGGGGIPAPLPTGGGKAVSDTGAGVATDGGTAGTTGGGTAEPTFEAYYGGVHYTDPVAYQNAVREDLLKQYNEQKASLDRQYESGLITFEQRQEELGKARDKSMQSIQGYFGAISPEAYQSTQGTMQNEAQDVYAQNTENLGREKINYTADTLGNIEALQSDYQNKADMLANQLADLTKTNPQLLSDYTNKVGAPSAQTPQNVLDQFGKYDLTSQLYGNALPKKAAITTPTKRASTSPILQALYPDLYGA